MGCCFVAVADAAPDPKYRRIQTGKMAGDHFGPVAQKRDSDRPQASCQLLDDVPNATGKGEGNKTKPLKPTYKRRLCSKSLPELYDAAGAARFDGERGESSPDASDAAEDGQPRDCLLQQKPAQFPALAHLSTQPWARHLIFLCLIFLVLASENFGLRLCLTRGLATLECLL